MFGQMPMWLPAAPTMKEKNGCKLYPLLFAHYLGSDHVNNLANKMEACLASLTYRRAQRIGIGPDTLMPISSNTPLPRR
jgi:hypothetical protein